jgi:DHA1 family bicyclomycin/chloramphenicol resistance-like MFS transporter
MTTGNDATRLMAAIMLVFSVSPMLAPLAGSALLAYTGWRAIFYALLIAAALSLLVLTFAQPETLHRDARQRFDLAETLRGTRRLLSSRAFLSLTFMGAFGMASFFVFLASAAFVYTESFGLSPTQFSLAFAANAVAFIGASQMAGPLGMRLGAVRLMRIATAGFAFFACALFGLALLGQANLWVCIIGLGLGNACLGLVIPTAMVMALDDHGDIAGLASSLGGTLQMMTGGVIVALMGPFFSSSPVPMIGVIALCALTAFLLSRLTVRPVAAMV